MNRQCTECKHKEMVHTGHGCYGKGGADGGHVAVCDCTGFCARDLSVQEVAIVLLEEGEPRGQIGDASVGDEFSAIREHLGKIMEKASAR
jgi:hypothetical protein